MAVGDKKGLLVLVFDGLIAEEHRERGAGRAGRASEVEGTCADRLMGLVRPFAGLFTDAYAAICDYLDGVGFPREWRWTRGGRQRGRHRLLPLRRRALRARFMGQAFRVNCSGMPALSVAVPVFSFTW